MRLSRCNGHHCRKWTQRTVYILDDSVCIPRSANTLGKGMNQTILPPAMSK